MGLMKSQNNSLLSRPTAANDDSAAGVGICRRLYRCQQLTHVFAQLARMEHWTGEPGFLSRGVGEVCGDEGLATTLRAS